MGIENLGNNQFGKLAAQNYNKSKAQENAVDLTNNQIKKTTTKGVNLNKGTLQVGQTDLTEAFMAKMEDVDFNGLNGKDGEPITLNQDKPKTEKSNSTWGKIKRGVKKFFKELDHAVQNTMEAHGSKPANGRYFTREELSKPINTNGGWYT